MSGFHPIRLDIQAHPLRAGTNRREDSRPVAFAPPSSGTGIMESDA